MKKILLISIGFLLLTACNKEEKPITTQPQKLSEITITNKSTDTLGIYTFEYNTSGNLTSVRKNGDIYARLYYTLPDNIIIGYTSQISRTGASHFKANLSDKYVVSIFHCDVEDTSQFDESYFPLFKLETDSIIFMSHEGMLFNSYLSLLYDVFTEQYNFDFFRNGQGNIIHHRFSRYSRIDGYTTGHYDTLDFDFTYTSLKSTIPLPAQFPMVDYWDAQFDFISPLYLLTLAGYNIIDRNTNLISNKNSIYQIIPYNSIYNYTINDNGKISKMIITDYLDISKGMQNYTFDFEYK